MQTFDLKVGATLSFSGIARDSSGVAIDLTGYTLTSQARDTGGTLAGTATITVSDQGTDPGEFTLTVPATTTDDWTAGTTVLFDLRLASGGGIVDYTETIAIRVLPRQTVPA